MSSGIVYLVGAGPGDPGLLTKRAIDVLQKADVVIYDYLVGPGVLHFLNSHAERICLGQHGRSSIWPQSRINEELVKHAKAGHRVVRLKGGDPIVFGHVAEEAKELSDREIPFEIVPGITAALAAPSYAGVPITHRDRASAVALITGHEKPDKEEGLDYGALASFPGTLVFYMGVTKVKRWAAALLAAGKPASTPVVALRKCARPDQQKLQTSLGKVIDDLTPYQKFPPPALVIVGDVAEHSISWFEQRPLFGETILVSRPRTNRRDTLTNELADLGAHVLNMPAIEIQPTTDWTETDAAIKDLQSFDWLIFASSNGVHYFFERLFERGHDTRAVAHAQIAAVGKATAETLREYSLVADLVPAQSRAESLATALLSEADGKRFLFPRANRGREVIRKSLEAARATVTEITVYESVDVSEADQQIVELMAAEEIDWVTVTSSAIAKSLVSLLGEELKRRSWLLSAQLRRPRSRT